MNNNRLSFVRKRASSLYEKYGLSVPINLNTIIDHKHIKVLYEENQFGIDGLCKLQKNPPTIVLNTEITYEPRRRFTVAHELGHICIPWHTGVDLCSLDDINVKIKGQQMINTQELEANTFASELLMPTKWLKENFELDTKDLSELVTSISNEANTSIMACFYALENVLPAGELFFVKTDVAEYWKSFRSINTNTFTVSAVKVIPFYNKVCYWKNEFKLSQYNVIHYKIMPAPNYSSLNDIYLDCNSNLEKLLNFITNKNVTLALPYIDKIINAIDDCFYIIVKIDDVIFRHFKSDRTNIRMHYESDDVNSLYSYIKDNFYCYGRVDLMPNTCILWVKECWRGDIAKTYEGDPHKLLKLIVDEIYSSEDSQYMLKSINGVMSSINSTHPNASKGQLCHYAKMRFETDVKYEEFACHKSFEQYIIGKSKSLIAKREKRE